MSDSVMEQDPVAWQEGYKAGLRLDSARAQCPYPAERNLAWSWRSGFLEARAERFRETAG